VNPRRPVKGRRPGRVGWLVISSFMWHLTRWDGLFLGTYLVTHLGGRPIDDQLVGIAMFAPMLLGSIVAGHLRKGLDPRLVVLVCEITLLPLAACFPFLAGSRAAEIWMVYPFEFAFGVGGMVNMTAQRELLARTAGPQRQRRVLSAELTGMSGAMMLGPLIGGISIGLMGIGPAFWLTAVLLAGSVTILRAASGPATLPALPSPRVASGSAGTTRRNLRQLLGHRRLAFVLGVTVVANLCYFAFTPLVPVVAKRLQAGPAMTGVLGSAAGAVQLVVAAVLVAWPARRASAAFAAGVGLCLACLGALAYAPDVLVAVLVLATAGIGQGLFNSLQTLLTVSSVPRTDRPAAFGVLTTTIGVALPLGMLVLGISSSLLGAQAGMLVSSLTGLAVLAVIAALNRRTLASGGGGDEADQAVEVLPAAGSPPTAPAISS
jgi:predicted MFS family arabinose efflux permease